jgi:mono/diheme cytochrome c family protein
MSLLSFPDEVDEISARLVAAGVVLLAGTTLVTGQWWLLAALVAGFVLRVANGPRWSPLALLVTRIVRPRLTIAARVVPGPPKRFAQGIGAVCSATAATLALTGALGAAQLVLGLLLVAASLEAFLGVCLGCHGFALLMRVGVIPESVCEECNDLSRRLGVVTDATT